MKMIGMFIVGLPLLFGLSSCNPMAADQTIEIYNSPNQGNIEIATIDGGEGKFKVHGITLFGLNDGYAYTMSCVFIGAFSMGGTTYEIQK